MSKKILYEGTAVDAVQRLLEKGRAYVDSDGYLSLLPGDTATRIADMKLALGYALEVLGQWEPGDSRAVSDEFVAMYSILCDHTNEECRTILTQAIEARRAETQGGSVEDESAVPKGFAQGDGP